MSSSGGSNSERGGGNGNGSGASPAIDPHLQALLEEKERLLRRLQDKGSGRGGSTTSSAAAARALHQHPHHDSHLQQREAGFNVYISGANEERIQEQRKREKKKDPQPRTKTWNKSKSKPAHSPTLSPSRSSKNARRLDESRSENVSRSSSRTRQRSRGQSMDETSIISNESQMSSRSEGGLPNSVAAAPASSSSSTSAIAAPASKPRRRQWIPAPVVIKGADDTIVAAPPPHQTRTHSHAHAHAGQSVLAAMATWQGQQQGQDQDQNEPNAQQHELTGQPDQQTLQSDEQQSTVPNASGSAISASIPVDTVAMPEDDDEVAFDESEEAARLEWLEAERQYQLQLQQQREQQRQQQEAETTSAQSHGADTNKVDVDRDSDDAVYAEDFDPISPTANTPSSASTTTTEPRAVPPESPTATTTHSDLQVRIEPITAPPAIPLTADGRLAGGSEITDHSSHSPVPTSSSSSLPLPSSSLVAKHPLSPPPIALRKTDVSILRRSLEAMANTKSSTHIHMDEHDQEQDEGQLQMEELHEAERETAHDVTTLATEGDYPVEESQVEISTEEDMDTSQFLRPGHPTRGTGTAASARSPTATATVAPVCTASDSSAAPLSPTPIPDSTIPAAAVPAPATSHSPTLPSRSLSSAATRHVTNQASDQTPTAHTAAKATAAAISASADTLPPPGPVVHLRTSVSYTSGINPHSQMRGSMNQPPLHPRSKGRPSTPMKTDTSILRTSLMLSKSFDKASVDSLLHRFQSLPRSKRHVLLEVLEKLEKGDCDQVPGELADSFNLIQKAKRKTENEEEEGTGEEKQKSNEEQLPSTEARERANEASRTTSTTEFVTAPAAPTIAAPSSSSFMSISSTTPDASAPNLNLALPKQDRQRQPSPSPPASAALKPKAPSSSPTAASHATIATARETVPTSAAVADATRKSPEASYVKSSSSSSAPSTSTPASLTTSDPSSVAASPMSTGDDIVIASFAAPIPTLSFRITSHWGHPNNIGMGGIEVLDRFRNVVRIPPSAIHMAWTSEHSNANTLPNPPSDASKIFQHHARTIRNKQGDKAAWQMQIDPAMIFAKKKKKSKNDSEDERSQGFELNVYLPSFFAKPALLYIYNYSKPDSLLPPHHPSHDSNKGIRQLSVRVEGRVVWSGEVPPASASSATHSTARPTIAIPLMPGMDADLPKEEEEEEQADDMKTGGKTMAMSEQKAIDLAASSVSTSGQQPAWLQGFAPVPAPMAADESADTSVAHPVPPTHVRAPSAGRRRGLLPTLSNAAEDTLQAAPSSVPLVTQAQAQSDQPIPPKRPMSGRRAAGARPTGLTSAAAAVPIHAISSFIPVPPASCAPLSSAATVSTAKHTSDSVSVSSLQPLSRGRIPSAGRRRPPLLGQDNGNAAMDDAVAAAAAASPDVTATVPAAAVALLPPKDTPVPTPSPSSESLSTQQFEADRKSNDSEADLEQSWDSLERFKHHHQGRIQPVTDDGKSAAPRSRPGSPSTASSVAAPALESASTIAAAIAPLPADDTVLSSRRETIATEEAPLEPLIPAPTTEEEEEEEEDAEEKVHAHVSKLSPSPAAPFSIPTLPQGRRLTFNLLSTFGDAFYIGLSSLELFDGMGKRIDFGRTNKERSTRIHASPASINVLPGYSKDPRVVSNLLDGVNATSDDMHVWLAPFSKGKRHVIVIGLPPWASGVHGPTDTIPALSMIRVWNYNKSRVHSARGVKDLEIWLDEALIFRGSIHRAPGNVEDAPLYCENILFTTKPDILARIAAEQLEMDTSTQAGVEDDEQSLSIEQSEAQRPPTAGGTSSSAASSASSTSTGSMLNVHTSVDFSVARPKTAAAIHIQPQPAKKRDDEAPTMPASSENAPRKVDEGEDEMQLDLSPTEPSTTSANSSTVHNLFSIECRDLTFHILSTWGDPYFVGLTGLEILGPDLLPIPMSASNLSAYPRDINTVPGHSGDNRTLDKLIDGTNITCNDNHMWLTPVLSPEEGASGGKRSVHGLDVSSSAPHNGDAKLGEQWLKIRFSSPQRVSAIRFYNYNKSLEDSYRGLKHFRLSADGRLVSPPAGFIVRKAPGTTEWDFGQTLFLAQSNTNDTSTDTITQIIPSNIRKCVDPTLPILPCGFVLKFQFLSTWGDPHYIGLNGLEMYDHNANKIEIRPQQVCAIPSSLNDLSPPPSTPDTRTVDKLFDGVNDTWDDRHMWLAPLWCSASGNGGSAAAGGGAPLQPRNSLTIFFDHPIAIAAIKFWNYSKTPSRGVHTCQIMLDELIVYDDTIRQAPSASKSAMTAVQNGESFAHTLLFAAHPQLIERESKHVYRTHAEQDVICVDERRVLNQAANSMQSNSNVKLRATASKNSNGAHTASRPMTMARGQ